MEMRYMMIKNGQKVNLSRLFGSKEQICVTELNDERKS